MKRSRLIAVFVGFMAIVSFANSASAYYHAGMGRFLSRDPGQGGVSSPVRVGQYRDGMNLYQYGKSNPHNGVDPSGTVVVVIHGVNTKAEWFGNATTGLNDYWKKNCSCPEEIIEFKWGDIGSWYGHSSKQGGHPNYATDNVADIYSTGWGSKERQYMADAAQRMQDLLKLLNAIKSKTGSKEPISVIAHSQGTILTLAALQKGAQLDNLIMMGSPLDIWPYDKSNNDLLKAKAGVRGKAFNYWSKNDEWAYYKGGIGAYGGDVAKIGDLGWITNREFAPGAVINGYTLPSTGDFDEYDHGDYMGKAEFFERIHGADLGCPPDNKISKDASMGTLKNIGKSVW